MNVIKVLKDLYLDKEGLNIHVSIFALLGIMTLSLNNVLLSYTGNVYSNYLGFAPTNKFELVLDLFFGLLLFLFFVGYLGQVVQDSFSAGTKGLPKVSLSAFSLFVRTLPIIIVWSVYLLFMVLLGAVIVPYPSSLFYIYYSLLICFIPFIHIILVMFTEKCEIKPEYFSPALLLKVMDNTLGAVILLSVQILILALLLYGVIYAVFHFANDFRSPYIQLSFRMAGLCLSVYFINIVTYIYVKCLVNIVQNKINVDV